MGDGDDTGIQQLQAVEEPGEFLRAAVDAGVVARRVPLLDHLAHLLRVENLGVVAEHEVTAGGQGVHQAADEVVDGVVGDVGGDAQQHQCDRLCEVQCPGCLFQDVLRVAQIGVDGGRRAFARAGEQRRGVGQDDRVCRVAHPLAELRALQARPDAQQLQLPSERGHHPRPRFVPGPPAPLPLTVLDRHHPRSSPASSSRTVVMPRASPFRTPPPAAAYEGVGVGASPLVALGHDTQP
ncbi:hypothetical protein ACVW19_005943 [Streptomyces sp. TE5632]